MSPRTATVLSLGLAQTLAWASAFYMPAILAAPMAQALGLSAPTVFGMFSVALLVSGLVGPLAGRLIDRHGGRPVLLGSSALFALALGVLGSATAPWVLAVGWLLLGLAMGGGLYEAAFATTVRLYGVTSRGAITGITLLGGFASTVGWSLSALMLTHGDWRLACFGWAALHVLVGAPLHARLPRHAEPVEALTPGLVSTTAPAVVPGRAAPGVPRRAAQSAAWMTALLATAFSLHWFVTTAMAAHLPAVLAAAGATAATAVAVGALVGPAQVAGRLVDFGLLRRLSPLRVAQVAALAHPLGAALMLALGAVAAAPFAVLHGFGNGIMTIVKGTLPLALFGAAGYGARQGWIVLPGRLLQGLSPWLFGVLLQRAGLDALWVSGGLCLLAFGALMLLRPPPA